MFTGLVETLGTVHALVDTPPGKTLTVAEPTIAGEAVLGDSIAVNGVCLTVVDNAGGCCQFQVGPETLQLTNLGELKEGDRVNLERSLRIGDRLGGHIVQGHVDGLGSIARRQRQDEWEYVWFDCPAELARSLIRKGSIAIDGISLTLVDVEATGFSVALIPHTLAITTLGFKQVGATVNLEIDLFAKYVWKFLENVDLSSFQKQDQAPTTH